MICIVCPREIFKNFGKIDGMKKLITILMSLQLIIAPVAYAETVPMGTPPAQTDAYYETGMGSEGGYDFWFKQVMILGMSIVGANVLTACYTAMTKVSMIGYMLGSVTYIASEIFEADAQNQLHKKNMSDLKLEVDKMVKEGSEVQKQSLIQRRDSEQQSLDYMNRKQNWMIAITAVYTAAMGAAIVEEILANGARAKGGEAAYDSISKANCKAINTSDFLGKALVFAITAAWGIAVNQIDGSGMITMIGGGLLGVLMLFSETVSKAMVSMYEYAWQRAITFGAHAALGGVLLIGFNERMNAAEENLANLDKVIAEFSVVEAGPEAPPTDGPTGDGDGPGKPKNGKIKELPKGERPAPKCMNAKREVSTAACGKPLQFKRPKTNFSGDLGLLDTALGHSVDMANSAAAGNMGKANVSAGHLANMAGKLKALTEKLKKKHNALLKSQGKKPIDYEKEIQKSLAKSQGQLNQVAAAKGLAAGSLGKASVDLDALKKDDGAIGRVDAAKGGAAAAAGVPDLGLEEEGISEKVETEMISKSGEGIEGYETNEQDISKASDVPIWVQLSNRYILNYTKIFDKKKEETTPVAEAPVPAPEVESVKK